MKTFILLTGLFVLTASADQCGKKKVSSTRLKAKLETKAICSNYTLRITEGEIDSSLVVAEWTDENTNKSYKKAFGLANPCDFPKDIAEGQEFYFVIDTAKQKDCAVCMAYYPTPPKKLAIKVLRD